MTIPSKRNLGSLVRAAARHVEKGVFALALLFLFACIFRAGRRETLPWTPKDLDRLTELARAHVEATLPPQLRVVRYSDIAGRSVRPISASSYAFRVPFDPPIWQSNKRSNPDVYPVRELLASAGRGAFAEVLADAVGEYETQGVRGERWVCLTGAIDYERQAEAFRDTLWQTSYRDVQTDRPDYVYFRVERAAVDPRAPEGELHWVRQHVRNMFLRQQTWAQYGTEPVDPRYLPPERSGISLVYPLGPLADRPWGPEVCHPRIPVQEATMTGRPRAPRRARPDRALSDEDERDGVGQPEYLLFRYFDFDVAPGKQYRYRVRLLLANPNYGLPPPYLEDENAAKVRYLETEWSEPTAVVRVPPDTGVLAGPARTWGARATVMMTRFLMSTGEVAFEDFHVRRGQLLDFADRVLRWQAASVQVAQVPFLTEGMTPRASPASAPGDRFKQPTAAPSRGALPGAKTVTYSSGMLLLDVRGGERMPGPDRFTEPASLLLMDRHGNLVVRNEMEDLPGYRSYQRAEKPFEAAYAEKKPALRGRGGSLRTS